MVMQTIAERHPGVRVSVVSSYADNVATPLYGLLNADATFDGAKFEQGLRDLSGWAKSHQDEIAPSAERLFLYPGARHGALTVAPLSATPGLTEFLNAQLDGDPEWATVEP
jgi:hypothetical protein